jgi:GT2 family glycosyltransferase
MNTGPVDFVVCTRNNRNIIEATLRAITSQGIPDYTLTVVDGLSTDGTPALVKSVFPSANVIVKSRDSGPAASRNIGMAAGNSPWIVLVDSDVRLAPDWTERQQRFMLANNVDISCGKLVYASQPQTLNATSGAMNRFGVAWDRGVGEPVGTHAKWHRCLWVGGSALILRRAAAEAIGGFDELMFVAHEDCDYGWRANLMGFRLAFNPEALAEHDVHGTLSGNERLAYLLYRNRLRSALINYESGNVLRYVLPYCAMAAADALLRPPRKVKVRALAWNVSKIPDTFARRSWVQSRRRVADRELWPLFEPGFKGPGYAGYEG